MKKVKLGRTGLEITPLGFGTSALGDMPGTYGYAVEEGVAFKTLHAIFDGPSNVIDASRNYGMGRSEARMGRVIRERGGLPEGFVVSTKLDRDMETGRFDGDQVRRSAEESLEALGLDRFQILHLHDPEHARDLSEITRAGGALDTLMRLKEEGLVEATGLAMGRVDMMAPLLRDWPFDIALNHNRYTLLNRASKPVFEDARARGMAVFNAAPYAGGVLAKGSGAMQKITYQDADEAAMAPVHRIESLCADHGVALGAAALQFSLRAALVDCTVIGVTKPTRVQQTLDWVAAEIPETLWEALAALPYDAEDPEANRVIDPS